jgi:UDP-N-acetyl-D-glucosamine dehydrogenase
MKINKKILVIGTGVIGLPMLIRCSEIKKNNKFLYDVFGYDRYFSNSKIGKKFPFETKDEEIKKIFNYLKNKGRINIQKNLNFKIKFDIIILSIGFDYDNYQNSQKNIKDLIKKISKKIISKDTLLLIETTLPPGFTDNIILPEIKKNIKSNSLSFNDISVGYSYERIMPGINYYKSIKNNFRSYSANNKKSKIKVKQFLKTIINNPKKKLYELDKIKECEMAKIIENSYRAVNIAFIDQWNRLSYELHLNLNKVLKSIRVRPTHSNLMKTGVGVGGYCLTKDPDFVNKIKNFNNINNVDFSINKIATKINKNMPKFSSLLIKSKFKNFNNKKILIIGVSYIPNFGDTRLSQGLKLVDLIKKGNKVVVFDDLIKKYNNSYNLNKNKLFNEFDIVIFHTRHEHYKKIIKRKWAKTAIYFDINNFFTDIERNIIKKKNINLHINGNY